jgi:hypothetical protein
MRPTTRVLRTHPIVLSNKNFAVDKICMMMTRLACNRAIESSYWRMDNNSDVGLLKGYMLYQLPIELELKISHYTNCATGRSQASMV